ncbi:MAG: DUF4198 domain-containing protein [Phycisphaerales bacterium]|nr:DUF4198 domain-containing protein [Phycisphaerales bacterium]
MCAAAQDVHLLMPESFAVGPRAPAALHIEARRAAKLVVVDWPKDRVRWFFARGGGTQENRDSVETLAGEAKVVAFPIANAGATAIGVDFKPRIETWDMPAFRAFAETSLAPTDIKPERQPAPDAQSLRVNRIETMKTFVRGIADGPMPDTENSTTVLSKTGQSAEIRLLADPLNAALGSDIPIKAYVRGDKRAAARLTATSLADGAAQTMTTDPTGAAHFTLNRAGKWVIEFHSAEPDADKDTDWTIYSATLTFEVNP